MLEDPSWALLQRLTRWLDQFKSCFGHRAQHVSLRAYIDGLLSDSPRKSMQAMLARVTEARSYQSFQHFITHSPWDAAGLWRRLLQVMPERDGWLILDDTPFLKQGLHSVGTARQYAGTLRKITTCQVAVTAALWNGLRAWLVGAELYLPEEWLTDEARMRARIPGAVRFQEKWRLGLTLWRRARAAGLEIAGVIADAGYGDVAAFRRTLDRAQVPYIVGISSDITVFVGVPRLMPARPGPHRGRPARRLRLARGTTWTSVAALVARTRGRWRTVAWQNGNQRVWRAEFRALRVTPVVEWRQGHRTLPELWLLAERTCGALIPHRYYFSNLPPTTSVTRLARLVHQRWAVEQQYSDLKTELGLDHFEGRTYPGWQHHVALTAVAYGFLQAERRRPRAGPQLTFPQVRAIAQEVFTGLLFITRDRYWRWLEQGRRYLPLRI